MTHDTLRALSRTYAAGDIDRETYRRERRALIEAIVAGEHPLLTFLPPEPESPTVFPSDDDEGDTTQEVIPSVAMMAAAEGRKRPNFVLLLAVAVLIGAALAWGALRWAAPRPP
ncbi:MAG: hypothetical protein ACU85V_20995, partial [Gammaproteobacteria bacterium]